MQEQLAALAQRDRDTASLKGLDGLSPSLIIEKEKAREEQEKAKLLVSHIVSLEHNSGYFLWSLCL